MIIKFIRIQTYTTIAMGYLPEKNNHLALILSDKIPPKNLLTAYAAFCELEIVPGRWNTEKNF